MIIFLSPIFCFSGVWKNYNLEKPEGEFFYYDGFIWNKSCNGLWRYSITENNYEILNPSDWCDAGGEIISYYLSRSGDIWFTIKDADLVKYDGINWQLFDLGEDSIYDFDNGGIAEDSQGEIWVSVKKGLAYKEGNHWKLIDKINGLSIRRERFITCDREGNLWLKFKESDEIWNIARKTGDEWTIYPSPQNYSFSSDSLLFPDNKGNLWFIAKGGNSSYLIKFSDGYFKTMKTVYPPTNMIGTSDGKIWLLSGGIVYQFIDIGWIEYDSNYIYPEFIMDVFVNAEGITSVNDGSVWVYMTQSEPIGFAIFNEDEITRQDFDFEFPNFLDFDSSYLFVALNENHGAIGVGSELYEIQNIENPLNMISLDVTANNPDDSETKKRYGKDLLIDSLDRIWWAANRLLVSFKDGVPKFHSDESWYPSMFSSPANIKKDWHDRIWTSIFYNSEIHFYYFEDGEWNQTLFTSSEIYNPDDFAVFHGSLKWILDNNKLFKYDSLDLKELNFESKAQDITAADSKGGIWLATNPYARDLSHTGLYYLLNDELVIYQEDDGLPSCYITDIEVAPDDSVWFSFRDYDKDRLGFNILTTGGIGRFDGENVEFYRSSDGLLTHYIRDMAVSSQGIAWFATSLGLSTLDINKNPEPKIRVGVNKHIVKEGEMFKLGLNLHNGGTEREINLVVNMSYNGMTFYFDFMTGQFSNNYADLPVTISANLKINTLIWDVIVPDGFSGITIEFDASLLDPDSSELIGDKSVETVKFVK